MKKVFGAILIFIYCLTSFGITVNEHYCMGKFVSWNITLQNHQERCSNCGMLSKDNKKKGCCHDEEKQIKLNDFQHSQKTSIKVPTNFVAILNVEFIKQVCSNHNTTTNLQVNYKPPLLPEIPLFVRNCTFLI